MTVRLGVTLPDHISDQTAVMMRALLWQITFARAGHYVLPLRRYHDSRPPPSNPERPWETLLAKK